MPHTWARLKTCCCIPWSGRKMNQNVQVKRLPGRDQLLELPQDLLWRILGFLDVRSLWTARLVCKDFWRSASGHLKALRLPSTALEQPPGSTFTQLSGLVDVEVSVASEGQLHMLAHPRIAPVVTHVHLRLSPLPGNLDQLLLLPQLRSLNLHAEVRGNKRLPPGLQALGIKVPIRQRASWLTEFSGLRVLSIKLQAGADRSLGRLTCLRNLRFLDLHCGVSALRVLSTFTMLTALNGEVARSRGTGPEVSLHSVACLTGLSHLMVCDREGKLRHQHLACLSRLTKLTCLDISHCPLAECVVASSFLVPLTGLVSLGLNCHTVGMSLLPKLNLEALQSLTLRRAKATEDIAVLQRAAGLTRLDIGCRGWGLSQRFEPTLAMMTRLRSLDLLLRDEDEASTPFSLSLVLRSLTGLTHLVYHGKFTADSDLSACASLPSLRSLWIVQVPEVTPACLPALQAMSGLIELVLSDTEIRPEHVTPEVTAAFDIERLRWGWPRLALDIY